jgi:hypothetical protein
MAIIGGKIWGGCRALHCGNNDCDGHATAIAEYRSYGVARRQAYNRVRTLKYNMWRNFRRLRCPAGCRKKTILHIHSPAPKLVHKRYFKNRKIWRVQYSIRWQYRVECSEPGAAIAGAKQIEADVNATWSRYLKKARPRT